MCCNVIHVKMSSVNDFLKPVNQTPLKTQAQPAHSQISYLLIIIANI